MSTETKELTINTERETEIIDITRDVQNIVSKSKIKNGIVSLFVVGSTGALTTMEYEPGLIRDIPLALERLFPSNIRYYHQERWHDDNGHSHVRASFLGSSFTIPLINGNLPLGTWQQIVFIELDVRPRTRKILVQIVGE